MTEKAESENAAATMVEEVEEGGIGTMIVNLYYALMNLAITLGAVAIMMVAFWLFKWANVSS